MESINVRRDDILWRFYCKSFTLRQKQIESPKNLCRYFWIAVNGFFLWIDREVKLSTLWLTWLVSSILFVAITGTTLTTSLGDHISIAILLGIVGLVWVFSYAACIVASLHRLGRFLKKKWPKVEYLLIPVVCIIVSFIVIQDHGFKNVFIEWLRLGKYLLIAAIGVPFLSFCLRHLIKKVSPQRRGQIQRTMEQIQRFFQTIWAVVVARKNRVCPTVNPPEDFKS